MVVILAWLTRENDKEKPASNLNLKETADKALMRSLNVSSIFNRDVSRQSISIRDLHMFRERFFEVNLNLD